MKLIYLVPLLLIGSSCTAPIRDYLSSDENKHNSSLQDTTDVQNQPDSIPAPKKTAVTLDINEWPGKEFIILQKQQMFNHLGYELSFFEDPASASTPIDTQYELPNYRLRCDKYAGVVLKATKVTPKGTEYLVSFDDPLSGRTVYGLTHKSAIKEIAHVEDSKAAKDRWIGRSIYSRKGVISTILPDGGFGSLKVKFQDSLKVLDIRWGITPLPVNPLWIIVKTPSGEKGFVPTRISRTNMMNDLKIDSIPWAQDLFERNPADIYPSWDSYTWEVINNHRIIVEMTPEQVLLSWGEPIAKTRELYQNIERECWKYNLQKIFFDQNGVIAVEENSSR